MKYLIAFLLLVTSALADDDNSGFYYAGDGLFMGTGTGWGDEHDIMRDLGLDVFPLDMITQIPPTSPQPLDAIFQGVWSGQWAYQSINTVPDLLVVGVDDAWAAYCLRGARKEPCPVGTVDMTGYWDTDDLGGLYPTHLTVFQARQPMNETCDVPEPSGLVMVLILLVCLAIFITLARSV